MVELLEVALDRSPAAQWADALPVLAEGVLEAEVVPEPAPEGPTLPVDVVVDVAVGGGDAAVGACPSGPGDPEPVVELRIGVVSTALDEDADPVGGVVCALELPPPVVLPVAPAVSEAPPGPPAVADVPTRALPPVLGAASSVATEARGASVMRGRPNGVGLEGDGGEGVAAAGTCRGGAASTIAGAAISGRPAGGMTVTVRRALTAGFAWRRA